MMPFTYAKHSSNYQHNYFISQRNICFKKECGKGKVVIPGERDGGRESRERRVEYEVESLLKAVGRTMVRIRVEVEHLAFGEALHTFLAHSVLLTIRILIRKRADKDRFAGRREFGQKVQMIVFSGEVAVSRECPAVVLADNDSDVAIISPDCDFFRSLEGRRLSAAQVRHLQQKRS